VKVEFVREDVVSVPREKTGHNISMGSVTSGDSNSIPLTLNAPLSTLMREKKRDEEDVEKVQELIERDGDVPDDVMRDVIVFSASFWMFHVNERINRESSRVCQFEMAAVETPTNSSLNTNADCSVSEADSTLIPLTSSVFSALPDSFITKFISPDEFNCLHPSVIVLHGNRDIPQHTSSTTPLPSPTHTQKSQCNGRGR
jgi:hypothetical protein